jgi:hypothetical protein
MSKSAGGEGSYDDVPRLSYLLAIHHFFKITHPKMSFPVCCWVPLLPASHNDVGIYVDRAYNSQYG